MSERVIVAPDSGDLAGLEALWGGELSQAYEHYLDIAEPRVALAAALVDNAVRIHRLGASAAGPAELLIGDLCLARASRLLADVGDMKLQVAFAQIVEQTAADAAAGGSASSVRERLADAVRTGK